MLLARRCGQTAGMVARITDGKRGIRHEQRRVASSGVGWSTRSHRPSHAAGGHPSSLSVSHQTDWTRVVGRVEPGEAAVVEGMTPTVLRSGPALSERQWVTVPEDYSDNGGT